MPFAHDPREIRSNDRVSARVAGALAIVAAATAIATLPVLAQGGKDPMVANDPSMETAIFAGGCFWCVESDFDKVDGVVDTVSGYIGGSNDNPTYKDHTRYNHREAVRVTYDPGKVDFDTLLDVFWTSVDPTDDGGQFCDRGFSYTTAIYAVDEEQAAKAEESKAEFATKLDEPIVTPVVAPGDTFWPAEDYHQDYYKKNPIRYNYYRRACGRDNTVEEVWGASAYEGLKAAKADS